MKAESVLFSVGDLLLLEMLRIGLRRGHARKHTRACQFSLCSGDGLRRCCCGMLASPARSNHRLYFPLKSMKNIHQTRDLDAFTAPLGACNLAAGESFTEAHGTILNIP